LKGEVNAWLSDPNYGTVRLTLEITHAAVEAAAVEARQRVRLNEGRDSPGPGCYSSSSSPNDDDET
jgi:hypothetical protein